MKWAATHRNPLSPVPPATGCDLCLSPSATLPRLLCLPLPALASSAPRASPKPPARRAIVIRTPDTIRHDMTCVLLSGSLALVVPLLRVASLPSSQLPSGPPSPYRPSPSNNNSNHHYHLKTQTPPKTVSCLAPLPTTRYTCYSNPSLSTYSSILSPQLRASASHSLSYQPSSSASPSGGSLSLVQSHIHPACHAFQATRSHSFTYINININITTSLCVVCTFLHSSPTD